MQEFDIAVIGAGSAGPKAARTAAGLGAKVVIFEGDQIGGECLYTGCVPSKSLIHSATLWNRIQRAPEFGLPKFEGAAPDFGAVMRCAREAIETVGGGDAVASFAKSGITTVCENVRFIDPYTVEANKSKAQYRGKQIILCTGSLPSVPQIPGLEECGYDTNRTVFNYEALPARLVVLGGGPIGCELGQVFARFGSQVTILHNGPRILARDDADAAKVLEEQLQGEGIRILCNTKVTQANRRGAEKVLELESGEEIVCDAILVSAGRKPNVDGLNIAAAGLELADGKRLKVSSILQTDVPHIWAAGDIVTEYKFTHVVSYEGAVAATNAVGALRGKNSREDADYRVVPRVTYTDPEVASVGLTPALARARYDEDALAIARFPFDHLDKALIIGDTLGFVQIVTLKADGTILGAQIVGAHAGSLISEICLAMRARLPVSEIALTMHAYPTMPEAVESAASQIANRPLSPTIVREMSEPEER
jgi:pyruvate/2-oxoglutarate dehydrogenase complex dihydrolipoamide dehydrogenase (E3) component